jgi:hypothetical protein
MLVALAILFSAAPPAHSDEVNLSRNRFTATIPPIANTPNDVDEAVSSTLIAALCEDGDGCTLRMQMIHGYGDVRAAEHLLVKHGARWILGGEVNSRTDGDLDVQNDTFSLQIGATDFCDFSDAEPYNSDVSAGFSVNAIYTGGIPTPGFSCVLTVID